MIYSAQATCSLSITMNVSLVYCCNCAIVASRTDLILTWTMQAEKSSFVADFKPSTEGTRNFTNVTDSNPNLKVTSDVILIFFSFVILIGIIGCVANGLVFSVLLSPKIRTQTSNLLIINQVAMDLYSCILLIVSYVLRLPRLHLTGGWGWFLCVFFQNDMLTFVGLTGSIVSVAAITAERYFKVVHPITHRKNFRNWMIYVAIPLTWINGILTNLSVIWSYGVFDGICSFTNWTTAELASTFAIFILIWQYFLPLLWFIYCYWHILAVIRGQMKVFNGHQDNDTVAQQTTANKAQMNVITTMIGICLAFFICWTPNQIWYMLATMGYPSDAEVYFVTLFLIFLNTTLNPFIYAAKHDAVKKGLRQMFGRLSTSIIVAPITRAAIA